MMRVVLVLVSLMAVCAMRPYENLSHDAVGHWRSFMIKYGKVYTEEEHDHRFNIFKSNLHLIDRLNRKHVSAHFAINKFADQTPQEIAGKYKMPNYRPRYTDADYAPMKTLEVIPDSYDWRNTTAITPVKDQGQCGSCWAFSVTEEIESMWILKGNPTAILSPQQIVDCDTIDGGCDGGDTPTAYQYVIKAGGMETNASYPYKAKDHKCAFNATNVVATISGWQYVVRKKNETEMLGALASAPLSICVDASSWDFYDSGIITTGCGHDLDHCVQAVGYGTDATSGTSYWIVRNSWGTDWGEAGYLRVQRNKGLCGIADEVTIAVV